MNEETRIASALGTASGDQTTDELLILVYDDLRRLAAQKLARESPGQTLQATALVHEAYLRLMKGEESAAWDHRGHFFVAAARAMQRILVERARQKLSKKRGGELVRSELGETALVTVLPDERLLDLDEALGKLVQHSPEEAKLVQLRYFAGLTIEEAAELLGITRNVAYRYWTYAKAFLTDQLSTHTTGD